MVHASHTAQYLLAVQSQPWYGYTHGTLDCSLPIGVYFTFF
jgi:hypothetical protein